jgi:beta-lactamase superfamily II metal-dependent hydrolase
VIDSAEDIPNDASLVFKMETENRSILICGDCHTKYMGNYLVETYGDKLHADILQCGHHGNNSIPFDTGFYEAVDPQIAIFDTPEWIMTSANYTAGALAGQLKEMGVEIRYYNTSPNGFRF